ncbi:MAG: protein translocase subunit SecD [Leptospirales bacterium]
MNTRFRITVILLAVIVCTILVWPNIGTRTINVHFLPYQDETKIEDTVDEINAFLKEQYEGRFTGDVAELVDEDGKKTKVFQVKGSWVQATLLNELSRIPGVNSEKVIIETMWIEKYLKAKPFKLGLDLQGGMNLLYEADFDELSIMLNKQYPVEKITELQNKLLQTQDPDAKEKIQIELDTINRILDLSPARRKEYILGAKEIIGSRVDTFGVSEPLVRMQGDDKIEISLPGVASPQQAKNAISSTARVEYHLAEPGGTGGQYTVLANQHFPDYFKLDSKEEKKEYLQMVREEIKLPYQYGIFVEWDKKPKKFEDPEERFLKMKRIPVQFLVLLQKPALSGDDMTPNAYAYQEEDSFYYTVSFELTSEGTKKFSELTTKNTGRLLAVVFDNKIVSSPVINQPILSSRAIINGDFYQDEGNELALIIKEGSLPVPLIIVAERSVGPTLGKASIEAGVKAILFGLIGVAVFMLFYYHMAGLVALFALALNLLFVAALLALMKFTVTLPGLAGIVLTLGMIVDANVIIYERIREELGKGKSFKVAISQGFDRATWTIVDSNLTTILAAIVLLNLGTGPIKGFAVTLFIGIITSLFTSLYVSRTLLTVLAYDLNIKRFSVGWKTYMKNLEA